MVYFGEPNQDPKSFPKAPFADEAFTTPINAQQTLNSTGAYQQDVFLDGNYSVRIETPLGSLWRESGSVFGVLSQGQLVASNITYDTKGNTVNQELDALNVEDADLQSQIDVIAADIDARLGVILQTVSLFDGLLQSGTGTIAEDDTSPQITEGNEFLALTITPLSSTSYLRISTQSHLGTSAAGTSFTMSLFRNVTTGARETSNETIGTGTQILQLNIDYIDLAGHTIGVDVDWTVRCGGTSGTTYFNGVSGARLFGGTLNSYIIIEEIEPLV